jgi:hypothetical protein
MYNKNITKMKKEKQIIVRVSEQTKNSFDNYCTNNGFSSSKRLRLLIEKDVEGKIKIK